MRRSDTEDPPQIAIFSHISIDKMPSRFLGVLMGAIRVSLFYSQLLGEFQFWLKHARIKGSNSCSRRPKNRLNANLSTTLHPNNALKSEC